MWRRLWLASVWAPGAIPDEEKDEQFKRRLFLPTFDIGMILVGFIVATHTVPSLDASWSAQFVTVLACAYVLAGALALVGVAFPAFDVIELGSKAVLILAMLVYPVTLLDGAAQGNGALWLGAVCLILLVGIPMERAVALAPKVHRHWQVHRDTREIRIPGEPSD